MKLFKGKEVEPKVLPELTLKRIPYEDALNKPKRDRKAKVVS